MVLPVLAVLPNAVHFSTKISFLFFLGPESFAHANEKLPEFPLIPASKGFCLSLDKSIEAFKSALKAKDIKYCD